MTNKKKETNTLKTVKEEDIINTIASSKDVKKKVKAIATKKKVVKTISPVKDDLIIQKNFDIIEAENIYPQQAVKQKSINANITADKIKVIKTVPRVKITQKIQIHNTVANMQEKSAALVPGVPYKFDVIRALILIVTTNYKVGERVGKVAGLRFRKALKQLAVIYYKNGAYFEKEANDTNNPGLIDLMGYYTHKKAVKKVRRDIYVENTDEIGVLRFVLQPYKRVSRYDIEARTIIDGVFSEPIVFNSLHKSKGTVGGFKSGVIYQIRSIPIFSRGRRGKWTNYFEIRVF